MSSYLVTGASRGLGYAFLQLLAQNPKNTVIGLVRNKAAAEKKVKEEGLTNVHIVEAQYTDHASLKEAAEAVKQITGGGLDYLINNAAVISAVSELTTLDDYENDFETMEKDIRESLEVNVIGVIKTIHAFIPLIRKGNVKKVVTISTGMADLDAINNLEIAFASPYAISKGAVNIAIGKYNAVYKQEGILFLSISPGYVATERQDEAVADKSKAAFLTAKLAAFAPDFKGALTPIESVTAVMSVVDKASIANGDGGAFVSHHGNKQWL